MGCNCSKKKPLATKTVPVTQKAPIKPPPTKPLSGQRQTFTLTTPDRRIQSFGSRLEAEAARVRAGGTGTIS